tara:strand:+ start:3771 stop:4838 length:1068 start_codon:yes stop_codon:yes gene_type:complete
MKVCIVCPYGISSPGGVWNHIQNFSHEIKNRKIDHIIVLPTSNYNLKNKNYYQIGKTFKIRSAGSIANITISPFIGDQVKKFLSYYNPDLIHIHEPFAGSLPMFFIKYAKCKIVATFHSNKGTWLYKYKMSTLFKSLYNKIDYRIAVSKSSKNYINKYFKNNYVIIPNGINTKNFKSYKTSNNSKILNLLFIGRNDKRKGLKYLIQALENYKFEFPIKLTIIGHEYKGNKIDGIKICNPGIVSEELKQQILINSDILCAPSLGYESFGIILLEAMASNTIVIASNIEGYNEIITHDINGLLFEPRNPKSIYDSINYIYKNKQHKDLIIKNGQNTLNNYDWNNISDKIIEVYKNLK